MTIADVANSKCHQRLDIILIIFTCTIQEISKVVCKKTLLETCAFITSLCCIKCAHYSKRTLHKQDCVIFCGCIAWQRFFENNFADFSNVVRVKQNQDFVQSLVAFPIRNISYCQVNWFTLVEPLIKMIAVQSLHHIVIWNRCLSQVWNQYPMVNNVHSVREYSCIIIYFCAYHCLFKTGIHDIRLFKKVSVHCL